MNTRGHNERSFRLDALANDVRDSLLRAEAGEEQTISGWLGVGLALNEARSLFPADRDFGEWCRSANLSDRMNDHDRAAAMWAAANADQFEEARQRGNPRTIRGIHAKWKEIEAEREAEARRAAEAYAQPVEDYETPPYDMQPPLPVTDETQPAHKPSDISGADNAGISAADTAAGGPALDDEPHDPVHAEKLDAGGVEHVDTPPTPAPDPYGYARLTDAALLDEANGLRAALDEEKARRKAAEAERDSFKAKWREATEQDMGRALGNAQRQRDTAKGRVAELMTQVKRLEYRLKKIEGEEVTL